MKHREDGSHPGIGHNGNSMLWPYAPTGAKSNGDDDGDDDDDDEEECWLVV